MIRISRNFWVRDLPHIYLIKGPVFYGIGFKVPGRIVEITNRAPKHLRKNGW